MFFSCSLEKQLKFEHSHLKVNRHFWGCFGGTVSLLFPPFFYHKKWYTSKIISPLSRFRQSRSFNLQLIQVVRVPSFLPFFALCHFLKSHLSSNEESLKLTHPFPELNKKWFTDSFSSMASARAIWSIYILSACSVVGLLLAFCVFLLTVIFLPILLLELQTILFINCHPYRATPIFLFSLPSATYIISSRT